MSTRRRLKTESQLIVRANNERAYAQALHSILFLSGNLDANGYPQTSLDMERHLEGHRTGIFTYTDVLDLTNGDVREEWYTAFVQDDCIHIKINFVQEWNDKPSEQKEEELMCFEEDASEGPKVLGKIDLSGIDNAM